MVQTKRRSMVATRRRMGSGERGKPISPPSQLASASNFAFPYAGTGAGGKGRKRGEKADRLWELAEDMLGETPPTTDKGLQLPPYLDSEQLGAYIRRILDSDAYPGALKTIRRIADLGNSWNCHREKF